MDNSNRMSAIGAIGSLPGLPPAAASKVGISHYGEDVFGEAAIRKHLAKDTAQKLLATLAGESPFDPNIANDVAHGMKEWALERGATHYTHWFQPMTGGTAEKHDAFLELHEHGEAILEFSGKNLVMGESDASSFPSGGLRCTFEARGYTAWDTTSPACIKRHSNGATLCIPTVFCSYTGEVLDKKTPVLRSIQALSRAVSRLMGAFGLPEAHTAITMGPEQEYFLIDRRLYVQRPDLVQTGRTLFGAPPPKHQQLEDHYFGAIRPRVAAFMTEVEQELWRLGIPAKTRHNEAAPAQFEIAPIFEEQNLAIDHNMLTMEVLRTVAERHGLVCLLHEKPFAGVNGSGKHNNWSVSYGKRNLLDPGETPHENAIFLTVLCAVIRAIDKHSDLLRATTGTAGNDCRLGAGEAPPAIISIFLGDQLTDVIEQIEAGTVTGSRKSSKLRIGVDPLPFLPRDATDRNRTSPFAFTGNKFEFRMPGSSQPCAEVNTTLNTIVAESLDHFSDCIAAFSPQKDFHSQLQTLLRATIVQHKRVIFNGDNYSAAWKREAARRGLPNLPNTIEAIRPMLLPKNQELFERYGVLSRVEVASRHEVFLEEYGRRIRIEGEIGLEIVRSMIAPAVVRQLGNAAAALVQARQAELQHGLRALETTTRILGDGLDRLDKAADNLDRALKGQHDEIIAALAELRTVVDQLEHHVDDTLWPLPKYREMLFIY